MQLWPLHLVVVLARLVHNVNLRIVRLNLKKIGGNIDLAAPSGTSPVYFICLGPHLVAAIAVVRYYKAPSTPTIRNLHVWLHTRVFEKERHATRY